MSEVKSYFMSLLGPSPLIEKVRAIWKHGLDPLNGRSSWQLRSVCFRETVLERPDSLVVRGIGQDLVDGIHTTKD
ncbi:MAG: hypothetical protein Q9169_001581 [Polycauliona sp. 2 TL-2023]